MITEVNGRAIKDARELAKQIGAMAPGNTAKLTVWRQGEVKSMSLTLAELPKEREAQATSSTADSNGSDVPKLGLMLAPAGKIPTSGSTEGVVVTNVDPNGLASEHGVKTGDVILDVSGKKVTTPVDARNAISDAKKNGKRAVLMRLKSDNAMKFVAIPIAQA